MGALHNKGCRLFGSSGVEEAAVDVVLEVSGILGRFRGGVRGGR